MSRSFNLEINPNDIVGKLSVGVKQKIEILKTLYRGARIIILDEPTAVLTPQETVELFSQLKELKNQGFTAVFISHKLREVKEISDRITIMRKGETVKTVNTEDVTVQEISEMMVDKSMQTEFHKIPVHPAENMLCVKDVQLKDTNKIPVLSGVSFTVRAGEILGVAGVEGNGQNELIEVITGLRQPDSGQIQIFGKDTKGKKIRMLRKWGMSYIPSDRMTLGIAPGMSIENNLISAKLEDKSLYKFRLFNKKKISALSRGLVQEFNIKCSSEKTNVGMLSGGNMQKVVVAREFTQNSRLIIAEQPTRGIDIGAAEFIHEKLVELRDSGCAVLLVSADLEELRKLSDHIIVMHGGVINAYIDQVEMVSENELGHYMLNVKRQTEEEIGRAYHA